MAIAVSDNPDPERREIPSNAIPLFDSFQQVSIFVDIGLDDSYTPQKISIRAGTYFGDLQEVGLCDSIGSAFADVRR